MSICYIGADEIFVAEDTGVEWTNTRDSEASNYIFLGEGQREGIAYYLSYIMDGDGLTKMVDHKGIGSLVVEGIERAIHRSIKVALYDCSVVEESV